MYGVGLLKFKDKVLGYILKGSFALGGTKGENSKVWAEQVQSAPVKTLRTAPSPRRSISSRWTTR